jgi:hypothetical protein
VTKVSWLHLFGLGDISSVVVATTEGVGSSSGVLVREVVRVIGCVEGGIKVVVAVGVSVPKRLETAGRLLHPNNKKAPIATHTRIIPQIVFEFLRVLFKPFLLR